MRLLSKVAAVAAVAWCLAAWPRGARAVTIAQHAHVAVEQSTDTVVELLPVDLELDAILATRVTSLPAVGKLYHLSANYIAFGYEPAKGAEITSVPATLAAGAADRVVYEAPVGFEATRFEYETEDVNNDVSAAGIVDVTASDGVTVSSAFHADEDGWTVETAASVAASWSGTSTGALNHFVYGQFGSLVVGANNDVRWHFLAPAKFLRNNARLYGGRLEFVMGHFEGDLEGNAAGTPLTFVELECSACASGAGITLAQREVVYTGGVTQVSLGLTELPSDGWLKDPHDDTVTAWSSPTQCEVFEVLAGLDAVRVYGDWTAEHEVVGIDSFAFRVVTPLASVSTACY